MAPTSHIHRPHHVRNEGREKRGKSNLLMWEPIHLELFACYFFSVALTSPVSAWCLMRGEFIMFIADTTLASFLLGMKVVAIFCLCTDQAVHKARPVAAWSPKPQLPVDPGHGRAVQTTPGITMWLLRSLKWDCASFDSHITPKALNSHQERL